jgi:hypothetical protein
MQSETRMLFQPSSDFFFAVGAPGAPESHGRASALQRLCDKVIALALAAANTIRQRRATCWGVP